MILKMWIIDLIDWLIRHFWKWLIALQLFLLCVFIYLHLYVLSMLLIGAILWNIRQAMKEKEHAREIEERD